MKKKKLLFVLLIVFAVLLVIDEKAMAFQGPNEEIDVSPDMLLFMGTRNTAINRTMLIESRYCLNGLNVTPLELSNVNGKAFISAKNVSINIIDDDFTNDGLALAEITIDAKNAVSGEYVGRIIISCNGGEVNKAIGVNLKIKDSYYLPIVVLLVGLSLSTGITFYRKKIKNRDELVVKAWQIRQKTEKDGEFNNTYVGKLYRASLSTILYEMVSLIEISDWDSAKQQVNNAQDLWGKWIKGRMDWIELSPLFEKMEIGIDQLATLSGETRYIIQLRLRFKEICLKFFEFESTKEVEEKLTGLHFRFQEYRQLIMLFRNINNIIDTFTGSRFNKWKGEAKIIERKISEFNIDDNLGEMLNNLDVLLLRLRKEAEGKGVHARGVRTIEIQDLEISDEFNVSGIDLSIQDAKSALIRQKIFVWVSIFASIAMLFGAGYVELYLNVDTFGSNAFGDYFTLFAWGFGVEAARDAVISFYKNNEDLIYS